MTSFGLAMYQYMPHPQRIIKMKVNMYFFEKKNIKQNT